MIKRLIQLILDQQAARRLEKEVNRTMGKIARESESRMKAAFRRIGGYVAAAFGVRAVVRFAKEMFRLGSSAEETGSKFQTVFGSERAAELDAFIGKFGRLAGLTRTEGREMLANFGSVFQGAGVAADASATLSEQMVRLAADLQSFHDVPVSETFAAIRSGATGEAEPLKRFGIVLRAVDVDARALANTGKRTTSELTEQERVVARLQLIYEKAGVAVGDLERTQDSTANRTRRLTNWFRQLREDLAVGLLPVFRLAVIEIGNSSGLFDGLSGAVQRLTVWVRENLQAIRDWGVVVVRAAQATIETFRFMGRMVVNAFDVVGASLALTWLEIKQRFSGLVNFVIDGLNKLPGVNIEFRMNQLTPAEFREQQRLLFEDIGGDAGDMADALGDLAESYRDVGRAAIEAATGQTAAANVPPPEPPSAQGRTWADAWGRGEGEDPDEGRFRRLLDRTAAAREAARSFREEELQALQDKAGEVADSMTSAFEGFFRATATGFSETGNVFASAGQAAREAGAAIVSGLVQGRAEAEVAEGTAALAAGLWPPNPAAIASALKHFAAAALFRAIPGVVRGGGPGGGGGGSVPTVPRGAVGSSVPGTRELPGTEFNLFIDPLSPADTRVQRLVLGAHQEAVDRFGPNVKVNIRSRTGG